MLTFAPLPHVEAVARIEGLPVVTREVMDGLLPELRAYAFCISGVEAMDQVSRVRDLVAAVPAGEQTWAEAKKAIIAELEEDLGEGAERRAELLLRTHTFRAYAAARYRSLMEQRDVFPWWQYKTHGDGNVRPAHAALNGKIFPAGHEIWQKIFPPWDWGCRCLVVGLMDADVTPEEQERLRVARDAAVGREASGTPWSELEAQAMDRAKQKLAGLSGEERMKLAQQAWDKLAASKKAAPLEKGGEAIPAPPKGFVPKVPESQVDSLARRALFEQERTTAWAEHLADKDFDPGKPGSLLETQRYTPKVYTSAEADAMNAGGRLYLPNGQTVSLNPSQTWSASPWSEKGSVRHTWPMIRERYAHDPEALDAFEKWARGTKIDKRQSVWTWLNGVQRKPKAPKPETPVPAADAWPELSGLKVVKKLGGSTGAELVEDATGQRYVRKRGNSAGHLREETSADSLYRALGVAVPDFKLYESDAGPVKLARFIEGETLDKILAVPGARRDAVVAELQRGFAADALLGNWDVVGLGLDNVIVDRGGKPWRIDNGGALRRRAQGKLKDADEWSEFADELWSLRDPVKNAQTARVFGELDMFSIARQIDGIEIPAGVVPAEVEDVLKARLGHMKDLARKSLDMEHDRWTAAYTNDLTRHMMGLRKAGITAGMPKDLTQSPGDVYVLDENGRSFDNLRATPVAKTYGQALQPEGVLKEDIFFNDLLAAAKTLNHHSKSGDFQFNATKVETALKHEALLRQFADAKKAGPVKMMAKSYLKVIEQLKQSKAGAAIKFPVPVPQIKQYTKKAKASAPLPAAFTPATPKSLVEQLADYVQAQGGDYEAVARWKGSQAGDSWNPDAAAYKAFLSKHLDIPDGKIFWRYGKADAEARLQAMQQSASSSVETAFTAHHAFVQELLAHTQLRHNDRGRRMVRLIRTENKNTVMKPAKLKPGSAGVELPQRGLCESSSPFRRTGVYGTENTVQAVPHSRITGVYLMERHPGKGGSSFLGDGENEFTFVTPGIPFDYEKNSPSVDAGDDAAAWGLKLVARP